MLQLAVLVCVVQLALAGSIKPSLNQVGRSAPSRPYGVPEGSLPCSPEEQAWWKEVRAAADDLRSTRRAGDKQKKNFASLLHEAVAKFTSVLHEGVAKSYKAPVPDTRPIFLYKTEPQYTEEARQRGVNGTVILQVELLSNGTVGDVKVLQRLDSGLDDNAITAARKTIFLPAVKNREFVTESIRMEMSFYVY